MAEMDDKLGAILNNPAMMQQIMAMAQSLGQQAPPKEEAPPAFDPNMMQKVMGLGSQTSIDSNQQGLLIQSFKYCTRHTFILQVKI